MPFMKGGRVEIRSIDVPDEVHPNDPFTAVVEAVNHAPFIFNDPDGCGLASTPCRGKDGYCVRADVFVADETVSQKFCLNLPFTGIPPNVERIPIEAQAPTTEGTYEILGKLVAPGSGSETGTVADSIQVTQAADRGPKQPDDGPTGGTQLKGGRISFDGLVLPEVESMRPGRTFEVGVVATNNESVIINDPDGCSNEATQCQGTVDGYCITSNVFVADNPGQSAVSCLNLPFTGTGSNTETTVIRATTPSTPGEYEVQANVETNATEERTDNASGFFTVAQSAPEPANGEVYRLPESQRPDDGGPGGGDGLIPGDVEGLALLGLGAWALSSIADIADSAGDALNEPADTDTDTEDS